MRISQRRVAENAFLKGVTHPHLPVIETLLGSSLVMTTFFSSSTLIALSLALLGALSYAGAVTA